jgi:DNA helicase HerA-like ATPase
VTNCNVLITGQPGAGKSTLAGYLARLAWRVLVLDPVGDYTPATVRGPGQTAAVVAHDVAAAVDALVEHRDEPAALIFRPRDDDDPEAEYSRVLAAVELVQREPDATPLALVVDEASLASDTHTILPELRRMLNLGRRWRVSVLTVVQVDTDIHRVTRRNAHAVVAMRQSAPSTELRRLFAGQLATLEILRPPDLPPVAGRHYLAHPPDVDLIRAWRRATNP